MLAQVSPAAATAAVFVIGLLVGSFLNVVILRLPARMLHDWRCQCRELLALEADQADAEPPGLVRPRSRCPRCRQPIAWYDNIPVLSWLLLRARCRHCREPIALRYPLVELASGLLAALVIWHFGPTVQGAAALVLTWMLIAAAGIDIDHQLLPDQITLPLLWLGLLFSLWFQPFAALGDAVIGAITGYGVLWVVYHLFRLTTGKEGMGFGDFKLLAALGAWLGWQMLPLIVLLGSLLGAVAGVAMMITLRRGRQVPIAFGPWLAAAGWIALLWGERMVEIWLY